MASASTGEMRRFGLGILAGLLALIGSLVAVGLAVARFAPDSMPAPAISSLVHMDEKLRFLRRHPALDPASVAVGSSITWRQLDGAAFEAAARQEAGGPRRFFNGATGYLQLHQTRAMAAFYLDNWPNARTLLVLTGLPDFADCRSEPAEILAAGDAARYAFGDWPAIYFYFRYVSPQRYAKTAMSLAGRRKPLRGDLWLDAWGSGPLQVPEERQRGLRYDAVEPDPACTRALDGLIEDMRRRGVRLLIGFPPVHPDYRARYPVATAWLQSLADDLEARASVAAEAAPARQAPSLVVADLIADPAFDARDFYDAFHLQWPAVQRLSTRLAEILSEAGPAAPEEQRPDAVPLVEDATPGSRPVRQEAKGTD